MADDPKTRQADADKAAADRKAREDAEAARKAQAEATEAAQADAAEATEEARKQSLETLKAQEEARPYPSQEEADRMKAAAAVGAAPYATRQVKP